MTIDRVEAAFQHSLETADWLRAHGNPTAGDELERKARTLHHLTIIRKGSRVVIGPTGETGVVQSTWWTAGDRLAYVLLDGTNREIEVYVTILKRLSQ